MGIQAKRRIINFDVYEVSGVDKAANDEKFLVFKRFDEETEGQIDSNKLGGDTMTPEEKVLAEKKAEMEETQKKFDAQKKYQKPFETPTETPEKYLRVMEETQKKFDAILAKEEKSETPKVDKEEKEDETIVAKNDQITDLESQIAVEKRVAELTKELADAKAKNQELRGLMPVRKSLELTEEEVQKAEEEQDYVKKTLLDIKNPENKKKYTQTPKLLEQHMRVVVGSR